MGIEQSFAKGTIPMPTKFIEHVTISMHMALEVASWNNQADNMVDPSLPNSGRMPVTTLGGLFPCRDHAISANPGGVMVIN